jgi:hypothetical protein
MDGFKNTTRMKTFGDVAPQAYAKGGSVKPMVKAAAKAPAKAPMKKAGGGDVSKMTREQRLASMEKSSRAMTPAQAKSLQALKNAKDAAPKQGPLIKPAREMTPAERRMNQMDRPTNNMGAEAYKGGGKVGGSKVPFAVKKVMRKAEGGVVAAPQGMSPEMPTMPSGYKDASPPPPMPASGYPDPNTTAGMMPVQNPDGTWRAEPLPRGPSPEELAFSKWAQSQNPQPQSPQEPTPQSVFGSLPKVATTAAGLYGTSPGPSPEMPNEPVMPMPKPSVNSGMEMLTPGYIDNNGNRVEATYGQPKPVINRGVPEDLTWYNNMVKEALAARDAQQAAQRADQAATAQAQQEMAAQAQMDRGLGLDLGGRRNLAPSYGRNPYLPRS